MTRQGVTFRIFSPAYLHSKRTPADWKIMNQFDARKMIEQPVSAISVTTSRNTHKTVIYFTALVVAAGAVSLVLLSPLILRQFGHIKGIDWAELSNVGQTYGAASAILAAVALLGVSLSLLMQARQARTEQFRITHERHMELLQIILNDPDVYYPVTNGQKLSTIDTKRQMFANMWVHYAQVGFIMGILSEEDVRSDILQPAFEGEPLRKWWADVRKGLEGRAVGGRRDRKFIQLVDEEYRKAVSEGSSTAPGVQDISPDAEMDKSAISRRQDILNGAILGLIIGIALGSHRWPKRH